MNIPSGLLRALLACALCCFGLPFEAFATHIAEAAEADTSTASTLNTLATTEKNVTLYDGDEVYSSGYESDEPDYYVGASGTIEYAGSGANACFTSSDTNVTSVDAESGVYTVKGEGAVTIAIYVTDADELAEYEEALAAGAEDAVVPSEYLTASYTFMCGKSLSSTKLKKTAGKAYVYGPEGYTEESVYTSATVRFSGMPFMSIYTLSYSNTGSNVSVYDASYNPSKKTVTLSLSGTGKTTVKLKMNDKTFSYKLTVKRVTLNNGSALMKKGTKKKLTLKGYSGSVKWSSSNKKVATVTSKGKVRGKKIGTCIIYAKVNGVKVGCAVSVTSARRYKVIKKAKSIGTGTYSQAKRMQSGYYDCSSLVWRAYKSQGWYLGSHGSWAPTAASIGRWGVTSGKRIRGGCSNANVRKLKLRAGDLLFATGASNGRYKGIYHVEMMTGYRWVGTKSNGKPYLLITWTTRDDGYCQGSGTLMVRP